VGSNTNTAQRTRCKAEKSFSQKKSDTACAHCSCQGQPENCNLFAYRPQCCASGEYAHHVIPVRSFLPPGERRAKKGVRYTGSEAYEPNHAPCMCLSKEQHDRIHNKYDGIEAQQASHKWKYSQARDVGVGSVNDALAPDTVCSEQCLKDQLDTYHNEKNITNDTPVRANKYGPAPIEIVPKSATSVERV
jgi:hypothetical protein